ncbi:MAG: AAA family ATPase [Nanoarchaeota archaeon]
MSKRKMQDVLYCGHHLDEGRKKFFSKFGYNLERWRPGGSFQHKYQSLPACLLTEGLPPTRAKSLEKTTHLPHVMIGSKEMRFNPRYTSIVDSLKRDAGVRYLRHGSTDKQVIDAVQKLVPPKDPSCHPFAPPKAGNLLVVDDHPVIFQGFQAYVNGTPHGLYTAENKQKTLQILQHQGGDIAVAFVDKNLSRKESGKDLLPLIGHHFPMISPILMSMQLLPDEIDTAWEEELICGSLDKQNNPEHLIWDRLAYWQDMAHKSILAGRPKVYLISGASASGKTTVAERIGSSLLNMHWCQSYTSRPFRTMSEVGHYFKDRATLDQMLKSDPGRYLRWTHGPEQHDYLLDRMEIDNAIQNGRDVVIATASPDAVEQLYATYPDIYTIFVNVNPEVLRSRVSQREERRRSIDRELKALAGLKRIKWNDVIDNSNLPAQQSSQPEISQSAIDRMAQDLRIQIIQQRYRGTFVYSELLKQFLRVRPHLRAFPSP